MSNTDSSQRSPCDPVATMTTQDSSDVSETTPSPDKTEGYLSGRAIWLATAALNAANFTAFLDIVAITVVMPSTIEHFGGNELPKWAPVSQMIGATVGQCILGYLSDIFPRRNMLLAAVTLLSLTALGSALCAYTSHAAVFVLVRTFAGAASGSISNLVNIAQNDFSPEERRLKLQGAQGCSVAMGSILGLMLGAAFSRWNDVFFVEAGLAFCLLPVIWLWVPPHKGPPTMEELKDALRSFDIWGILSGMGFVVPLILLLCKGQEFSVGWIAVLAKACSWSLGIFLALGIVRRPTSTVRAIVPFKLWRNPMIAAVLAQNFAFGAVYYSFIFFLPEELQVVRRMPVIRASSMMVPYFVLYGLWSWASGHIVAVLKQRGFRAYSIIFVFGHGIWTFAMALLAWDSISQVPSLFIVLTLLVAFGTGSVSQNSIQAIQGQVEQEYRAVITGLRNVLRFFGGAVGIALSGAVRLGVFKSSLPSHLQHLDPTGLEAKTLELPLEHQDLVEKAGAKAIAWVFGTSAILMFICTCLTILVWMKEVPPKPSDAESKLSEEESQKSFALIRVNREEPMFVSPRMLSAQAEHPQEK